MLYDNAQLARVYLHTYQITGNEFYKRVTTEILEYVAREMTDANGGFYSSHDADTVDSVASGKHRGGCSLVESSAAFSASGVDDYRLNKGATRELELNLWVSLNS